MAFILFKNKNKLVLTCIRCVNPMIAHFQLGMISNIITNFAPFERFRQNSQAHYLAVFVKVHFDLVAKLIPNKASALDTDMAMSMVLNCNVRLITQWASKLSKQLRIYFINVQVYGLLPTDCFLIVRHSQNFVGYFFILFIQFYHFIVYECFVVDFLRLICTQLGWQQLCQSVVLSICQIRQHSLLNGRKLQMSNQLVLSIIIFQVYNIQLINSSQMKQQIRFSEGVAEYISMALQIWPALQLSLSNLHEITSPPQGSPIPPRNYQTMTNTQFIEVVTKDMFKYIYQHDVKTQHIIDYLNDILAMLNTEQQNENAVQCMANQLISLISELPQGDATRLINFRTFYHTVKGKKLQHSLQQAQQVSQSDSEGQQDDQEQQNQNWQENEQNNMSEQVPKLTAQVETQKTKQQLEKKQQQQQQSQEQDDGWIVVKKKSKK